MARVRVGELQNGAGRVGGLELTFVCTCRLRVKKRVRSQKRAIFEGACKEVRHKQDQETRQDTEGQKDTTTYNMTICWAVVG